jgi:hypothetical protein
MLLVEMNMAKPQLGKYGGLFKKPNMQLSYGQAIVFLNIFSRERRFIVTQQYVYKCSQQLYS